MKHYILLSVRVPNQTDQAYADWLALSEHLRATAPTTKGIVMLAANVWLLPRNEGMTFASECIAAAQRNSLKAEARFLTEDD